jgi:hypothetical protein
MPTLRVAPIDKLSAVLSIALAAIVLREHLLGVTGLETTNLHKCGRVGVRVRRRSFFAEFRLVFRAGRRVSRNSGNSSRPFCGIHPLPQDWNFY